MRHDWPRVHRLAAQPARPRCPAPRSAQPCPAVGAPASPDGRPRLARHDRRHRPLGRRGRSDPVSAGRRTPASLHGRDRRAPAAWVADLGAGTIGGIATDGDAIIVSTDQGLLRLDAGCAVASDGATPSVTLSGEQAANDASVVGANRRGGAPIRAGRCRHRSSSTSGCSPARLRAVSLRSRWNAPPSASPNGSVKPATAGVPGGGQRRLRLRDLRSPVRVPVSMRHGRPDLLPGLERADPWATAAGPAGDRRRPRGGVLLRCRWQRVRLPGRVLDPMPTLLGRLDSGAPGPAALQGDTAYVAAGGRLLAFPLSCGATCDPEWTVVRVGEHGRTGSCRSAVPARRPGVRGRRRRNVVGVPVLVLRSPRASRSVRSSSPTMR